jgi:hypothetical protein
MFKDEEELGDRLSYIAPCRTEEEVGGVAVYAPVRQHQSLSESSRDLHLKIRGRERIEQLELGLLMGPTLNSPQKSPPVGISPVLLLTILLYRMDHQS